MCDVSAIVIWPHVLQASFSMMLELWFNITWFYELYKVNKGDSRCYAVSKSFRKDELIYRSIPDG